MKNSLFSTSDYLFILGLFIAVILSVAITGQENRNHPEKEKEAIQEFMKEWTAACNSEDADRKAALWTEDAIFMLPGKTIIGREAIRDRFQFISDKQRGKFTRTIYEITVEDDYALVRSRTKIIWTPRDGGDATVENDKDLNILQKQPDGSWKIARLMFNKADTE